MWMRIKKAIFTLALMTAYSLDCIFICLFFVVLMAALAVGLMGFLGKFLGG